MNLLTEDGFSTLMEDGFRLLLDGVVEIVPEEPAVTLAGGVGFSVVVG